ncbi:cation-translocating P-type ATPase [Tessaracoccus sp. ZS01]|uniref:heavy metal translocating P-type ATPase n=1 Tax=Tessaracoccus sp. ZS01 TaxID=1906324 RepID=UPI00096FD5A3|nr:heavy metal translocating P-type ATPase [Tessaracoccus sp. ZS01]MCG6568166.1 heavy metal translocating P-type ATPase [Tessaracoccus sp. ZS01]OMG54088.1 carbonate dehydratase [Tessaracoccus sp. ZS01]
MSTSRTQPITNKIQLDIQGMTCASCAARIEKKLNKVDGVTASVNYSTEKATVEAPPNFTADDLIAVVEKTGYGATLPVPVSEKNDEAAALKPRVLWSFILSTPVVLVSMIPALQFPGWQWAALVLSAVVVLWLGRSFHTATFTNLRHGATTMDTLVTMGTGTAFAWSLYAMLFGHAGEIGMKHHFEFNLAQQDAMGFIYFEAAVVIISFLLLGRYIEARAKTESGAAMRALLEVGAKQATVLRDGEEQLVDVKSLAVGDLVVVRPGEKVAADGEVVEGRSAVDASIITGESLPVEVEPGTTVVGGSVNTTGRLVVRTTAVGANSQLARIAKMVEEAQEGKADVQRLADKVSSIFVPVVLGIAAVTLVGHLVAAHGWTVALSAAISVLIIACPCALGLATPSALMVGTGRGAQLGTVIRGPQVLERARRVQTIVFDKTGTLTTGHMSVVDVEPVDGVDREELLGLAAAVEAASEHPIAAALVAAVDRPLPVEDFQNVPGRGVRGIVGGRTVYAGSPAFMADLGHGRAGWSRDVIGSVVEVADEQRILGRVVVADTIKESAGVAVEQLKKLGLTPVLLSGDNEATARAVAESLGIHDVRAGVTPEGKVAAIKELQAKGQQVAMVGDGVNDAAAIAQADLGIAMGTGTDAAIAAGDITLMRHDLSAAVDAVRLSRATLRTIKGNLLWAFGYNTAAIPLAAFGMLTPMIAGAAMAFSSVFVVLNSLRLRGFRSLRKG